MAQRPPPGPHFSDSRCRRRMAVLAFHVTARRIDWTLAKAAAVFFVFLLFTSAFQTWPAYAYGKTAIRWVGRGIARQMERARPLHRPPALFLEPHLSPGNNHPRLCRRYQSFRRHRRPLARRPRPGLLVENSRGPHTRRHRHRRIAARPRQERHFPRHDVQPRFPCSKRRAVPAWRSTCFTSPSRSSWPSVSTRCFFLS